VGQQKVVGLFHLKAGHRGNLQRKKITLEDGGLPEKGEPQKVQKHDVGDGLVDVSTGR